MRHPLLWSALLMVVLSGCAGLDLPTREQSLQSIERDRRRIDSLTTVVNPLRPKGVPDRETSVTVPLGMINAIMQKLAGHRTDDIRVRFLRTVPLWKEDKNLLGISYSNQVNVDSGFVSVNLKSLRVLRLADGRLDLDVELEGTGTIQVSGRYTGVPASAQPGVQLYLRETVSFAVTADEQGMITMTPHPRMLLLKTKISIKLLDWALPWYQEVPLQVTDLIAPMRFPAALATDLPLPVPTDASTPGSMTVVPHSVRFLRPVILTPGTGITYSADVDVKKRR